MLDFLKQCIEILKSLPHWLVPFFSGMLVAYILIAAMFFFRRPILIGSYGMVPDLSSACFEVHDRPRLVKALDAISKQSATFQNLLSDMIKNDQLSEAHAYELQAQNSDSAERANAYHSMGSYYSNRVGSWIKVFAETLDGVNKQCSDLKTYIGE